MVHSLILPQDQVSESGDGHDAPLTTLAAHTVAGTVAPTPTAHFSFKSMQRSALVQVPDDEVMPHMNQKKVEIMVIDPVNAELGSAEYRENDHDNTNGIFSTSTSSEKRLESDTCYPVTCNSKPTDWDSVSISAIVELEMMKEDIEEEMLENLEKFSRLLNLETAHNGKDHSVMRHEIGKLMSVLKAEINEVDNENDDDDYYRPPISDINEQYDYWNIDSDVLSWNPPLQSATLQTIKEEDEGDDEAADDDDIGEGENKTGNQKVNSEGMNDERNSVAGTRTPLRSETSEKSTIPSSQGVSIEIKEFADMLAADIISDVLQTFPENESRISKQDISEAKSTAVVESFSSGSSVTIFERKESITLSVPLSTASSSGEHVKMSPAPSTGSTAPASDNTVVKQSLTSVNTMKWSDLQFSSMTTSTGSKVIVPSESNTAHISVILTSPSNESLNEEGMTAADSGKPDIQSAPLLSCNTVDSENTAIVTSMDKNVKELVSAPALMTSSAHQESYQDHTSTSENTAAESETEINTVVKESLTSVNTMKWSDLQFSSMTNSATSTGSKVTVIVPAESNTAHISVILTSTSNESLDEVGVIADDSGKPDVQSAPLLSCNTLDSENTAIVNFADKNERKLVSAPALMTSSTKQASSQDQESENMGKMAAESEAEINSATSTGNKVTVIVPAESNTAHISVILTSPSNESLDEVGVTAEDSGKPDIQSAPLLFCNTLDSENTAIAHSADKNVRELASAPTLMTSSTKQASSHNQESENMAKMVAESEAEINSKPALDTPTPATIDGGHTTTTVNTDDADDDDTELVFHSKSGQAVYISPVTCSTELMHLSKESTTEAADKHTEIGTEWLKSPSDRKVSKSLAAFRRSDLEEASDPHDQRSTAEKLGLFRAMSESNTICNIHTGRIRNPDRSKISFDELFQANCSDEPDIIPEQFLNTNSAQCVRSYPSNSPKTWHQKGKLDRSLSETLPCASNEMAQNQRHSRTSHGKTMKSGSRKSASKDMQGMGSRGKKVKRSSKSSLRSKSKVVADSGKVKLGSHSTLDTLPSWDAEMCNGKMTATSPALETKSSELLSKSVSGRTEDSGGKQSSGFLPKIPSTDEVKCNVYRESSLSTPNVACTSSSNKSVNSQVSDEARMIGSVSYGFLPTIQDEARCNMHREPSLSMPIMVRRSSYNGSVNGQVSNRVTSSGVEKNTNQCSKTVSTVVSSTTSTEKQEMSVSRSPSMKSAKTEMSAIIEGSSRTSTFSSSAKYRQAVLKAKSSIGGSALPSKLKKASKCSNSVPLLRGGGLDESAGGFEQMKASRAEELGLHQENYKSKSLVKSESTEMAVSGLEQMKASRGEMLHRKTSKSKSLVKSERAVSLEQQRASRTEVLGLHREKSKPQSFERVVSDFEQMKASRAEELSLQREKSKSQSLTKSTERVASDLEQMKASRAVVLGLHREQSKPQSFLNSESTERNCSRHNRHQGGDFSLEQKSIFEHGLAKKTSRSQSDKNHDRFPPLTPHETISLPKIPLTSDGLGYDATAWIRANRDLLKQFYAKKTAGHLSSSTKIGRSQSDRSYDKLPPVMKHEHRSLPGMLDRPHWH